MTTSVSVANRNGVAGPKKIVTFAGEQQLDGLSGVVSSVMWYNRDVINALNVMFAINTKTECIEAVEISDMGINVRIGRIR